MPKANVLIVEDESIVAMDIRLRLEHSGYNVCDIVAYGEEVMDKVSQHQPDLILMDMVLKGKMDGIQVAMQVHDAFDIPVIYLTAYGDDNTLERAKLTQPYGYILKPFEGRELYTTIEMALYKSKMEKELKSSEEKYRLLVNNLPNVVFKGYADWSVDFFDDKISLLTGYQKNDFNFRKLLWSDIILPEDRSLVRSIFIDALKAGKNYIREYRIMTRAGSIIWLQEGGQIVMDKSGKIDFISGAFLDITSRKNEENALAKIHECFLSFGPDPRSNISKIVQTSGTILQGFFAGYFKERGELLGLAEGWNIPEGFINEQVKQKSMVYEVLNSGSDPVLVRDELEGSQYYASDPNVIKFRLRSAVSCAVKIHGQLQGVLSVVYQKNKPATVNELRIVSILAKAIGIEEERLEEQMQLVQSTKMAGIGTLASGVAHEFNNLTAIMRAKAEMALLEKNTDNIIDALKSVMNSTERAQKITQSLLSFSRRVKPVYEKADIVSAMEETLGLVEREFEKQRIKLVRNFSSVGMLYMDVGQIQQVFLNILVNAKEAMPKGGQLSVDIYAQDKDILVKFCDTGGGIKKEILDKIFEPFFSTKENTGIRISGGTGLGLSVSLGIIQNHQGDIRAENTEQGACFIIRLPMVTDKVDNYVKGAT